MNIHDDVLDSLAKCINDVFPRNPHPEGLLAAYGCVDADKLANIFNKHWWLLNEQDLRSSGSSEIVLFISADGRLYFLPGVLLAILRGRKFGWFEETLLPASPEYRDVVEYFSDGTLQGGLFERNASDFWMRVLVLRSHLNASQRECIARYIEVVEHLIQGPSTETAEFKRHLNRWIEFWLQGDPSPNA